MLFLTFHQHAVADSKDVQLCAAPVTSHGGVHAEQTSQEVEKAAGDVMPPLRSDGAGHPLSSHFRPNCRQVT